jgi:hypothetical protein
MRTAVVKESAMKAAVAAAIAFGLGFGLFCALADQLPYSAHLLGTAPGWLGNIAGTWLVLAFVAGARSPSQRVARVAAPLLLIGAVAAYYGFIVLAGTRAFVPLPVLVRTALLWLVLSLVSGLVFGWLGHRWRAGATPGRMLGPAVLGLALVVESLSYLLRAVPSPDNPYFVLYSLELAAGLLLPWALARWPGAVQPTVGIYRPGRR